MVDQLQALASRVSKRLSPRARAALARKSVSAEELTRLIGTEHFDLLLALSALRSELTQGRLGSAAHRRKLKGLVDHAYETNPEFFDSKAVRNLARTLVGKSAKKGKARPKRKSRPYEKVPTLSTVHYAPAIPLGNSGAHCVFGLEFDSRHDPVALKLTAGDLGFLAVGALSALEQELVAIPTHHNVGSSELAELKAIGAGVAETRQLVRTIEHKLAKLLHHPPRKSERLAEPDSH